MDLVVDPAGRVRCVYAEAIDLAALGPPDDRPRQPRRARRRRAAGSPTWRPSAGRCSGRSPLRSEALAAERAWLEAHWPTPA